MAAAAEFETNRDWKLVVGDGRGDSEGLGVGGAAADFMVSLLTVSLMLSGLSSRIVIGAAFENNATLLLYHLIIISSEEKSQQKFPAPLSARSACNVLQRTGLKTNLCRNNCSLQIMGGNWLKAHFRSHKTLYKVHMLYTI